MNSSFDRNFVTTRTPYRISFFGGGTDFPDYFNKYDGEVLSTTIDKYCYIHVKKLQPFFDYNFRVIYSKIELCKHAKDIKHPSVKNVLKFLNLNSKKFEIFHQGDLPAMSGTGSSSAFTVGLLNCLSTFINKPYYSKHHIAKDAIYVEQKLIKENVGCQDQLAAAHGGFNHFVFKKKQYLVNKINPSKQTLKKLNDRIVILNSNIPRYSSNIVATYKHNDNFLSDMKLLVQKGINILHGNKNIDNFGYLLHQSWELKKMLSSKISNKNVDDIYNFAIRNGALGGKLIGAGSSGFYIFYTRDKKNFLNNICKKFKLINIPFKFESNGTTVTYSD